MPKRAPGADGGTWFDQLGVEAPHVEPAPMQEPTWVDWTIPTVTVLAATGLALAVLSWLFRWLDRRVGGDPRLDRRRLRALQAFASVAIVVGSVYIWIRQAPTPPVVDSFLFRRVEPWFWASFGLAMWVIGGWYVTRKVVSMLEHRADRTRAVIDDALAWAVRKPFFLILMVAGTAVWAELVPLSPRARPYVSVVIKGGAALSAVMFVDGFVQAWIRLRERTSTVLATSGGVLRTAARVVLYIVGALMIMSAVGLDITPLIASLGIGSLALGLALQKTLEDFLAGLLIAADQPIRVGDFVELESGLSGTVLSIGWRTTRLRTRDDMYVVVPNSRLGQATVVNRSMPDGEVSFTVPVGIHYDSDLDHAADVTLQVAERLIQTDPRAVQDYEPRLIYEAFNDSSIDFRVWLRARHWEQHFGLKDAFIRKLHVRYREEGIVIPFPIRTLDVPDAMPLRQVDGDP
ncbi:MAG: mechanosensitive ion channel family protein [Myxococcota bacterium]